MPDTFWHFMISDLNRTNHLIILDTLQGEMVAVVPEGTPKHVDPVSLQLLEDLHPKAFENVTLVKQGTKNTEQETK